MALLSYFATINEEGIGSFFFFFLEGCFAVLMFNNDLHRRPSNCFSSFFIFLFTIARIIHSLGVIGLYDNSVGTSQ